MAEPELYPADATLTSEAIFVQSATFPEFLKTIWQPLADALGVVVGVVVVRRSGHGNLCGMECGQRSEQHGGEE